MTPSAVGATPALELRRVTKRYRRGDEVVTAVRDADLTVASGEVVAVTGPSGSGKSTLLAIAGALTTADSGTVLLGGGDVGAASAGRLADLRRRTIGIVFQSFHLLPALTVAENVALPLVLDGVRDADRVAQLLARVGLGARASRLPGELSGGERQRVAVARALVAGPALVLADEPTGNLDAKTGARVLDLLVDQARGEGAALLLVTHDAAAAARADRVMAMADGRLAAAAARGR